MYSKTGDVRSSRSIFDRMKEKTCVTWSAMIGCYAEKGDLDEALDLFQSMEAAGQKPDLVTAVYMLSGCGQIGALETGRWIHSYVDSHGLCSNLVVSNALIDMYSKCGSMTLAREIFDAMHEKSVVSWTTIISGHALNGKFKEALDRSSFSLSAWRPFRHFDRLNKENDLDFTLPCVSVLLSLRFSCNLALLSVSSEVTFSFNIDSSSSSISRSLIGRVKMSREFVDEF